MKQDCKNYERNIKNCNCTYEPCPRKGYCCECITYHRKMRQFSACFFDREFEKTYDRSFENFVEQNRLRKH